MKLNDAVRALREEGKLSSARKRAVRERVLGRPRASRKLLMALPIAAVLAATSVWAAVLREPPHPREIPPAAPMLEKKEGEKKEEKVAIPSPPVIEKPIAVKRPTAPPEDTSLRAYREAERLQRVEKDCTRAVPAWDAYLARAGSSSLAVDARFNRALCLVRLGRADEARVALEPFARGESGSYRQSEAKSLLEELDEH